MILYALLLTLTLVLYWYFIRPLNYFKKRGIPYLKPLPFVGNYLWTALQRLSFAENQQNVYNAMPDRKYCGVFLFNAPTLMIRDPDLIKQITVKEFDHFTDHAKVFFNENIDPLFDNNLFSLKGTKWRDMRATLSPAFTGSKMRGMFYIMKECADQLVEHFVNEIKKNGKGNQIIETEFKNNFTRYTNDVIATTAFGIKCDSFKNPDNRFYLMGREMSYFSAIKLVLTNISPKLMQWLKLSVISTRSLDYFRGLIKETVLTREQQNIIRPDMLNLLMRARKEILKFDEPEKDEGFSAMQQSENEKVAGKKLMLSEDDIAAQALIFFIAGFETISTTLSFACYELALNPDIQNRLYAEIQEAVEKCNGNINYEALIQMKYLDMVVSETLRKWPPAVITDRVCTSDIELDVDGEKVKIEKDMQITFPIFGLHRDPKYYPNPDKFDPERFSDENKAKIKPFSYIPFGAGPRTCIGSRFALLEGKLALFHLVKHFEIVPTKKTQVPPVIDPKTSNFMLKNGIWLGLKFRH